MDPLQHLGNTDPLEPPSERLGRSTLEGPCTSPLEKVSPYRHSTILSTILRAAATEITTKNHRYDINSAFSTFGFKSLFLETRPSQGFS